MEHRIRFKVISLNLFIFYCAVGANRCFTVSINLVPQYKLVSKFSRSMDRILVEKSAASSKECRRLAISRKALAFNFYRADGKNPNVTVKCLPRVGVFFVSDESRNWTEAQKSCQEVGGKLAHIASEERTEGLAKFIGNHTPVFVGLSNRRSSRERIWKNEFDEPLHCFDYRSWNKGEPSGARGCLGLTITKSQISDNTGGWRVLPCSQSFPFICEILPLFKPSKKN